MPLPAYQPPTKAITIRGMSEPLKVRGLSFEDVTLLIHEHLPEIVAATEAYRDSLTEVYSTRSMDGFIGSLLKGFPALASHLIAHAANASDEADVIRTYPASAQLAILAAIAELTLEDAGGLTDPSPALGAALQAVLRAFTNPAKALPGSTGLSGAQ